MKISLGVDHGALGLRQAILEHLQKSGHQVIDHGTHDASSVDYPDFAKLVGEDVLAGRAERGVLACTSGIGMSMAANKIPGIRAALIHFDDEAALCRQHNHANVVVFGQIHTTAYEVARLLDIYLASETQTGRHERRVGKLGALDGSACALPPSQ